MESKPPTAYSITDKSISTFQDQPTSSTLEAIRTSTPKPMAGTKKRTNSSLGLDNYFLGPRDLDKHSKWPVFLRMHGSILPKMVLPLAFVGGWATAITCISEFAYDLGVSPTLLTVLGFVVGLSLSFRSSTAYERYAEGRRYWAQLMLTSHNLARTIWVHAPTPQEGAKEDLLAKVSALNLIVAFAYALKHKLRFEPHVHYDDLQGLVDHIDTLAKEAHEPEHTFPKDRNTWKAVGEYLGVSFAESNPRKEIKRSKKPLGNLPLELLNYLAAYCGELIDTGSLKAPIYQTLVMNAITTMNDIMTGTDRVLNTPLPLAYSIAISQVTWVYVLVLPFQLFSTLNWLTIPATMVASYIILGIALIGREIENPFGHDVNDLPLDAYCDQLASEIDIIMSAPPPKPATFIQRPNNQVLYPLSEDGYEEWSERSIEDIRDALRIKTAANMPKARPSTSAEGMQRVSLAREKEKYCGEAA